MKNSLLKILIFILIVSSMLFAVSCGGNGNERESKIESQPDLGQTLEDQDLANYYWVATSDKTCTITGVKDTSVTDVRIPSCVTKIEDGVFENCENIQRVYSPSIEAWCNIEFVMDNYATSNPLVMPYVYSGYETNSVEFYINEELVTDLVIPSTVKKIKVCAFATYGRLKSVIIRDSVKTIGDYAFASCYNLENVRFGGGITSIGGGLLVHAQV